MSTGTTLLRRTAATTLSVLATLLFVFAAKAAPPDPAIAFVSNPSPTTDPAAAPAPTAPPSMDDARDLQQAGRWDEAAEAWHAVIEAEPDNGTAWFNFGYCLHAGGHLEKAIEVHRKAASFEEFHGIALYNLGCAYALTGKPDAAFEALAASQAAGFTLRGNVEDDTDLESLRHDPRYAALLGRAGDDHDAAGGNAGGGDWGAGDRSGGGDWGAGERGSGDRGRGGDIHGFIAGIRQFIEHQLPRIEEHVAMFARQAMEHASHLLEEIEHHLANDERLAAMAEQIGQWLGGGPGHGHGHGTESAPPARMERREKAPPIQLPPDDTSARSAPDRRSDHAGSGGVEALMEKGRRLQADRKWNEAATAFSAAAELAPDEPATWFGRAYCLHMAGRYEEAIKAHRKAASFEEVRGISLYNLACAYALTGKLDDAMMALRESRRVGFDLAEPIGSDRDLDNLRDDPRFQKLLAELGVEY